MMEANNYTDETLIQALRAGGAARRIAWEYMYKNWSDASIRVIREMGGGQEEAIAALHEVAVPFEKTVCKPEFHLKKAALRTYFISCVKNRWLKDSQKQSQLMPYMIKETPDIEDALQSVEAEMIGDDLRRALDELLDILGKRCRRVLRMFAQGYSMREIAMAENWKDAAKAKKAKYMCQKKLKDHIRQNPDLKKRLEDLLHG